MDKEYPDHYAVASLKMQFYAGPEKYAFYACPIHVPTLAAGDFHNGLFYLIKGEEVQKVNPWDEIECDLCREG